MVSIPFYKINQNIQAIQAQQACKSSYMKDQGKTRRCENCGQPVLQSDVTCWHCGVKLPLLVAEPTFLAGEAGFQDQEKEGLEAPPMQIIFYALLTAFIAFALLFVLRSLGKQPRLAANFAIEDTPAMELFAPDGSFSIEVPPELVWYFPQAQKGQGPQAAQMADNHQFEAALEPLYGLASDGRLLLLAQAEAGTLTVAWSERLGQLTVEEVVRSLPVEPFAEGAVLVTKNGNNREGSSLALVTLERDNPPQLCRQVFLPDSDGAYLAAICADRDQFNEQSAVIDAILTSLTIR